MPSPSATASPSTSLFDPLALDDRDGWIERFRRVRAVSEEICAPLEPEDYVVQTMADVSPPKWHLAHTTWFFETFVLGEFARGYEAFHPAFNYLFNSYYNAIGEQYPRPRRGLLSRPTVRELYAYRRHVDAAMAGLLAGASAAVFDKISELVEIGLHHEQQHQELMLTDLKHILCSNPLRPVYRESSAVVRGEAPELEFCEYPGGVVCCGHEGDGFAYDNEGPRHRVALVDFRLAKRLVTNGEYAEFIAEGGYRHYALWLSEGWATVQTEGWKAPEYWEERDGEWWETTLHGARPIDPAAPVTHVSYFEAAAFAHWRGDRLASEFEWEHVARLVPREGHFYGEYLHPACAAPDESAHPAQMYGDAWEWTQSPYTAYPGFRAAEGAVGEYNGKFMCNQLVLRGGSCATSRDHIRPSYRNFFPPDARWQFSGIRLAQDL